MEVIEVATGRKRRVIIQEARRDDIMLLTKKAFSFNWKQFSESTTIYKIQLEGNDEIIGAVGLIDWNHEKRIEIKLLASSVANIGKHKIYDRIAGCLIAFACRRAVSRYGPDACISLVPKTVLIRHYINRYYMAHAGWQLYLHGSNLFKLLNEYL